MIPKETKEKVKKIFDGDYEPLQEAGGDNLPEVLPEIDVGGLSDKELAEKLAELLREEEIFFNPTLGKVLTIEKYYDPLFKEEVFGFKEMNAYKFKVFVGRFVRIGKVKKFSNGSEVFVPYSLPVNTARAILESEVFRQGIRQISEISKLPLLYYDESSKTLRFLKRGYNPTLGVYTLVDVGVDKAVKISGKEGLEKIKDLLKEFCFKTQRDRDKAILFLILPALRYVLSPTALTPAFFIRGNQPNIGKDYLAGLRTIIYEGEVEELEYTDYEENRKHVAALIIKGQNFFHFSNVRGFLDTKFLEQVITAKKISLRILGKNESVEVHNRFYFSLSGNKEEVSITRDFQSRMILIDLFYPDTNTRKRKFERRDLHEIVQKNRGEYVGAVLAMVFDWFTHTNWAETSKTYKPKITIRFPEVGAAVESLFSYYGLSNPFEEDEELSVDDEELSKSEKDIRLIAEEGLEAQEQGYLKVPWNIQDLRVWLESSGLVEDLSSFSSKDVEEDREKKGTFYFKRSGQIKLGYLLKKFSDMNIYINEDLEVLLRIVKKASRQARNTYQFVRVGSDNVELQQEGEDSQVVEEEVVSSQQEKKQSCADFIRGLWLRNDEAVIPMQDVKDACVEAGFAEEKIVEVLNKLVEDGVLFFAGQGKLKLTK